MIQLEKYWNKYNDEISEILVINKVDIASIEQVEDGKFQVYDYDSDFQGIFSNGLMPAFNTKELAKEYVEESFLDWLKKTYKDLENECSKI